MRDQCQLRGQGVGWVPVPGSWQMLPAEVGRAQVCGGWSSSSTRFCLLLSELQRSHLCTGYGNADFCLFFSP